MALFSRRDLQRMIEENARFLRPDQVEEHVRRLNTFRPDYLSTEWEIALLNAFNKVGDVQHEPELGGSAYLDLVFKGKDLEFAAEIATVSDQERHRQNPVDALWDELARRVHKRKITSGGFDLKVGPRPDCVSKGRGTRHALLLPGVSEFGARIFNRNFDSFLQGIRANPAAPAEYRVQDSTTDVAIRYVPGARTWSGSHLSYTSTNVIDDNPVFNGLKTKAAQLNRSKYTGIRGVFICDGGCEMLTTTMQSWATYPIRDVVSDFFRQHQSVAFCVIIGLRHDNAGRIGRGHYRPELQIAIHP